MAREIRIRADEVALATMGDDNSVCSVDSAKSDKSNKKSPRRAQVATVRRELEFRSWEQECGSEQFELVMFGEEAEFEEPEKPTGKTMPPAVMSDCKQD